jgi:hypothetical protein
MTSIQRLITRFTLFASLALCGAANADGYGTAGVWDVYITPDGAPGPVAVNRVHFDQDGTLTNIDPLYGTGLGTWEHTPRRGYASEIVHYFNAGTLINPIPGKVVIIGAGQHIDSDTAEGEFTTTISLGENDPNPTVFSGTIYSKRVGAAD